MNLNCIAVDDEPLALGLVSSYIEQTPFLTLVGKYDNAIDALKASNEQKVDIIFLDIQMNDLTGIELARVLDAQREKIPPKIVFTTAYDQFALESYKVDAVDYLMKPFSYEEFLKAANKAKKLCEMRGINQQPASQQDFLFLKVEYQLVKVGFDDILYIEGLKDYVKVHLSSSNRPLLSLTSLKSLEEKLPGDKFMRVHRSYIISFSRIDAITKNTVQIGDHLISVSDNYKDKFHQFIQKWTQ